LGLLNDMAKQRVLAAQEFTLLSARAIQNMFRTPHYVVDILRQAHSAEAERLLEAMDEIYGLLVTVDFPDAITGNLRRTTDLVRGLVERTRGDLTTSLQQDSLRAALDSVEKKLGPRAGDGEA